MHVDVGMTTENKFLVERWWATGPQFVIDALQRQLEAAQAIWPELRAYEVGKRKGRPGGIKGGKSRAESLSPERRSEIAKAAASARWNGAAQISSRKAPPLDELLEKVTPENRHPES